MVKIHPWTSTNGIVVILLTTKSHREKVIVDINDCQYTCLAHIWFNLSSTTLKPIFHPNILAINVSFHALYIFLSSGEKMNSGFLKPLPFTSHISNTFFVLESSFIQTSFPSTTHPRFPPVLQTPPPLLLNFHQTAPTSPSFHHLLQAGTALRTFYTTPLLGFLIVPLTLALHHQRLLY